MRRFFLSFGELPLLGNFAVNLHDKVIFYVHNYTRCARGLWCRVYRVENSNNEKLCSLIRKI